MRAQALLPLPAVAERSLILWMRRGEHRRLPLEAATAAAIAVAATALVATATAAAAT
jgi:hypothetical protein